MLPYLEGHPREMLRHLAERALNNPGPEMTPAGERMLRDLAKMDDEMLLACPALSTRFQGGAAVETIPALTPADTLGVWRRLRLAATRPLGFVGYATAVRWIRFWSSHNHPEEWKPRARRTRKTATLDDRLPWTDNRHLRTEEVKRHKRWGDCVPRALATALQRPYEEVMDLLRRTADRVGRAWVNPVRGTPPVLYETILRREGWTCRELRQGRSRRSQTRVRRGIVPDTGRFLVLVRRHMLAIVDGVIHDGFDSSRGGSQIAYTIWSPPENTALAATSPK